MLLFSIGLIKIFYEQLIFTNISRIPEENEINKRNTLINISSLQNIFEINGWYTIYNDLFWYLLANFGISFFSVETKATSNFPKYLAHNCSTVTFISADTPSSISSFVKPIKTKLYNSQDVHLLSTSMQENILLIINQI